jgi:hypothetical protein
MNEIATCLNCNERLTAMNADAHNCEEALIGECVYCEGVADFQWLEGGWYVCTGCIKEGKTDTQVQGEEE